MAAKRNFAFFLVILFLPTLLLFSRYNPLFLSPLLHTPHFCLQPSSILLESPKPNPTLKLTIKVLTYDRHLSLSRCLCSLAAADYAGDKVDLHIYIDHFELSTDSYADLDRKLESSRKNTNISKGSYC